MILEKEITVFCDKHFLNGHESYVVRKIEELHKVKNNKDGFAAFNPRNNVASFPVVECDVYVLTVIVYVRFLWSSMLCEGYLFYFEIEDSHPSEEA